MRHTEVAMTNTNQTHKRNAAEVLEREGAVVMSSVFSEDCTRALLAAAGREYRLVDAVVDAEGPWQAERSFGQPGDRHFAPWSKRCAFNNPPHACAGCLECLECLAFEENF